MDRRAFLRLTVRGNARVLELSCERLHVRWVDAKAAALGGADLHEVRSHWEGEPPLDVVAPTTADLFAELERRLAGVDAVRLTGREWLVDTDLRTQVQRRIEAFRLRGGHVE